MAPRGWDLVNCKVYHNDPRRGRRYPRHVRRNDEGEAFAVPDTFQGEKQGPAGRSFYYIKLAPHEVKLAQIWSLRSSDQMGCFNYINLAPSKSGLIKE